MGPTKGNDLPVGYTRPLPPPELSRPGLGFARALGVERLIREEFVRRGGLFFDVEHGHLTDALIGVLWASSTHVDKGSVKAGTAQLLKRAEPRKWGEASRVVFLHQVFGDTLPEFLITLSGPICAHYDDREFFALLDHELLHCAVAKDQYGAPRFSDDTGRPVWTIRPHDHEGFSGATERWGAQATGAAGIVLAGMKAARFDWVPGKDLDLSSACGVR